MVRGLKKLDELSVRNMEPHNLVRVRTLGQIHMRAAN
jgi:hypothetical protein